MVPKLIASSLLENREFRRQQLVSAALELALESGVEAVKISAVAKRAGISRASVYEYFSSSADLITDLIVEEMDIYSNRLQNAIRNSDDPYIQIELWIREALRYIADGRHLLVKSLSTITPPEFRQEEVKAGHRKLMATFIDPLSKIGIANPRAAAALLQSTIDATAIRIDSGNPVETEIQQAIKFALAGLRALEI
jgi:AcrR family transcriptional regulator